MSKYWNPAIETMPRQELKKIQESRLQAALIHAYEHAPLYRELYDREKVDVHKIRTIEDFQKYVPFIDKDALRDYRDKTGDPYCGILTVPPGAFAGYMESLRGPLYTTMSTGTTGAPSFSVFDHTDIEITSEYVARWFYAIGIRTGDFVVQGIPGGHACEYSFKRGLDRIGANQLRWAHHPLDAYRYVHMVRLLKPKAVIGAFTPPFVPALMEELKNQGIDPIEFHTNIEVCVYFGEALTPGLTEHMRAMTGKIPISATGPTDGGFAHGACLEQAGTSNHHVYEDILLWEVVDPKTGNPLPDGDRGEFVMTTLHHRTAPLIRFQTDDIGFIHPETCPCGRTHALCKWVDREGFSVEVAGKTIFSCDVRVVLEKVPETRQAICQMVNYAPDMKALRVRVVPEITPEKPEVFIKDLENRLQNELGVTTEVQLVERSAIGGTVHKFARVVKE